ncbi:MAG: FKBP-type peptidyl-prolyl cis-trans isomerase [Vicingaceae bacterium]
MKAVCYFVFFCLALTACQKKKAAEYKTLNKEVQYKYLQFGEGESIAKNDYISISLTLRNEAGDTLHYVPNYPYLFQLKSNPIDSAWLHLSIGDSAEFLIARKLFNQRFSFYGPSQSDSGKVKLNFRIKKSLDANEVEFYRRKLLSKRELEEQADLKRYMNNLQGYIDTIGDVYRNVYHINHDGVSIKNGALVSIEYQGRFLNGYQFEDSREKGVTPTFVYGQEYQMIEGMQMGLKGLKSGESVKIILPSRRAFGREGSLAGIVPPYTAVIFDVNIIKVVNQ